MKNQAASRVVHCRMVIGSDGIPAQRFFDFAPSENPAKFDRDGLAEVIGVVIASEIVGHRLSLPTMLCTLTLYPIRHHGHQFKLKINGLTNNWRSGRDNTKTMSNPFKSMS